MQQSQYKGYWIQPASIQLLDTGRWNMEVYIQKKNAGSVAERKFTASDTFVTEEEAIQHCINFAEQIIDGKSDSCTVVDL